MAKPTRPESVKVTLELGPCHRQKLTVHPVTPGYMPASVLVSRPRPPDAADDKIDYFTYYRLGGPSSNRYMYWRDVMALEEAR